jgi:hypothetical protein
MICENLVLKNTSWQPWFAPLTLLNTEGEKQKRGLIETAILWSIVSQLEGRGVETRLLPAFNNSLRVGV